MRRGLMVTLLTGGLVLGALAPSAAVEMRTGPMGRVGSGETIDDDLYVAGASVAVDGRVIGDLVATGGTVDVRGQVDGGLLAAGGTVSVLGTVGGTVRALGGTVEIRGPVGADAVVGGGTILLDPAGRIARDLVAAGGRVVLGGAVSRNAKLGGGRVEVGGSVGGRLQIRATEVVILDSAVVGGDLTYSSERPIQIASGARIAGRVIERPFPVRPVPSPQAWRGFRIGLGVLDFLWMLLVALALVAIAPSPVQATADAARSRGWASLGWGLVLLVGVPAAVIALMIVVIGIPVGILLILTYLLGLFISHVPGALAIGQRLFPGLRSRYAEVAIGVGLVAIATNLPYVGWLLRLIVVVLGLGALGLAASARRRASAP